MSTTNGRAAAQTEQSSGTKNMIQTLMQGVGIFMLTQFVVNQVVPRFFGKNTTQTPQQQAGGGSLANTNFNFADAPPINTIQNYSAIPQVVAPLWPEDSPLDIKVYLSPSLALPTFSSLPADTLVLDANNFKMGNYSDTREISTTITIPREVQNNGTLWAHFFIALSGSELDPMSAGYDVHKAGHFFRPMTQHLVKKRVRKVRNLLDANNETAPVPEEPRRLQISNFYHPNHSFALVPNSGVQNYPMMHGALRKQVVLEPTGARDATGQNAWYYPIIFNNEFWQLRSHMTELNSTVKTMPLNINLHNLANWKYSLYAPLDDGIKQQSLQAAAGNTPMPGGGDGSEFEKFKEILLDTNPYLLGTTFIVSIFHMIFEMLAFKNDISHWRKKKDNIGTSFRTILANVVMQAIIFLYLVDNSEGTSWMILASQGFGILLEAWKVTKTVNVRLRPPPPDSYFKFLPYVVVFEDKYKLSEIEVKTQEYDQIAFKYLYIVAVPLLGAYAVYSLIYETHKSWYSFVIETLVGSVYAYGFLMMVPSLYINYRLKSVAHMPSKAMTYKFLNTFIDDLFAFTIRMPTLHRLATLRDDVIFFVYLYQKWAYKVDYSRVNEFGQGGDDDEEEDEKKDEVLAGQDTKELKSAAPVASATSADVVEGKGKAKKRK